MGAPDKQVVSSIRIDLAAAFRLAVRMDLHEGVCNHFSVMLPEHLNEPYSSGLTPISPT